VVAVYQRMPAVFDPRRVRYTTVLDMCVAVDPCGSDDSSDWVVVSPQGKAGAAAAAAAVDHAEAFEASCADLIVGFIQARGHKIQAVSPPRPPPPPASSCLCARAPLFSPRCY
jgi:hypothetical protein